MASFMARYATKRAEFMRRNNQRPEAIYIGAKVMERLQADVGTLAMFRMLPGNKMSFDGCDVFVVANDSEHFEIRGSQPL